MMQGTLVTISDADGFASPAIFFDKERMDTTYTKKMLNKMHCPNCKSRLRLLTNKQTGQQFLGCVGFPNCKFTCNTLEMQRAKDAALEAATWQDTRYWD